LLTDWTKQEREGKWLAVTIELWCCELRIGKGGGKNNPRKLGVGLEIEIMSPVLGG
jgi:hypothetical protein